MAEISDVTSSSDVQQSVDIDQKPITTSLDSPNSKILDGTEQFSHETANLSKLSLNPVPTVNTQGSGDDTTSNTYNQTALRINLEQQILKAKRDLESMVLKYAKSERENLQNKNKVDELDKKLKRSIKDNDQLANRIKLLTNDKTHLTEILNAKVAQLTVLEQKNAVLNSVQGVKLKEQEENTKRLEKANDDLLKQIESYKSREGELLDFSERLSMKHMMLQSELDEAPKQVANCKEQYEAILQEREVLVKEKMDLAKELETLSILLEEERKETTKLREENDTMKLGYRNSIDELHNEIKVMRKKHTIAVKELLKEIKQLRSQLE